MAKKKAWLDYEEKRTLYIEIKGEFVQKRDEFNVSIERVKPVRARIENCEILFKKLQSKYFRYCNLLTD